MFNIKTIVTNCNKLYLICVTALLLNTNCRTVNTDGSSTKFYGADNQSGDMQFEAYIDVAIPKGISTKEQLFKEPARTQVMAMINKQIQHLYGTFSLHDEFVDNPGIIEGKGTPILLEAKFDAPKQSARVTYSYKDRVVFKKKIFRGNESKITFLMPRDPQTIYAKSLDASGFNPCTDKHYNGEGDFWYFWTPTQEGCNIPDSELQKVTAKLTPKANTKKTYPDYAKILGDNGNGRLVKVMFLVGIDESFRHGDLGKKAYEDVRSLLVKNGFKLGASGPLKSFLTLKKDTYDVEIDLQLMDPDSPEFLTTAADGLETGDIFIYDGHSGLGSYLNLPRFEKHLGRKLKLPLEKSQIFYFNGCSTFPYYNADYFALKKNAQDTAGSRNLDIITTSVGATFDVGAGHDSAFLTGVLTGKYPTWQKIMDDIYAVDKAESTLSHVNGDEDNPTSPPSN